MSFVYFWRSFTVLRILNHDLRIPFPQWWNLFLDGETWTFPWYSCALLYCICHWNNGFWPWLRLETLRSWCVQTRRIFSILDTSDVLQCRLRTSQRALLLPVSNKCAHAIFSLNRFCFYITQTKPTKWKKIQHKRDFNRIQPDHEKCDPDLGECQRAVIFIFF